MRRSFIDIKGDTRNIGAMRAVFAVAFLMALALAAAAGAAVGSEGDVSLRALDGGFGMTSATTARVWVENPSDRDAPFETYTVLEFLPNAGKVTAVLGFMVAGTPLPGACAVDQQGVRCSGFMLEEGKEAILRVETVGAPSTFTVYAGDPRSAVALVYRGEPCVDVDARVVALREYIPPFADALARERVPRLRSVYGDAVARTYWFGSPFRAVRRKLVDAAMDWKRQLGKWQLDLRRARELLQTAEDDLAACLHGGVYKVAVRAAGPCDQERLNEAGAARQVLRLCRRGQA
jgi:hypothetical protein